MAAQRAPLPQFSPVRICEASQSGRTPAIGLPYFRDYWNIALTQHYEDEFRFFSSPGFGGRLLEKANRNRQQSPAAETIKPGRRNGSRPTRSIDHCRDTGVQGTFGNQGQIISAADSSAV